MKNVDNMTDTSIYNELRLINQRLDRLRDYLVDNPETGEPGIVNRMRSHNDRLEKLELKEKIRDIRLGLICAGITGLLWLLRFLYDIFKH